MKARDNFFGNRRSERPASAAEAFSRIHCGPGDSSLVRLFEQTRDELRKLREMHAAWITTTRMP